MKIDKTVLITGGTGSIGLSLVAVFAASYSRVFFQYNSNETRADELKKRHGATPVEFDFETEPGLFPLERVDVLINNSGINESDALTHEVPFEIWLKTLQVNLSWPFLLSRQYLPAMIREHWGRIINISSIYGLRGTTNNLAYNVSKHGLSGLTKTVGKEYAHLGVTCNEICPGPVDSELMNRIADRSGRERNEYLVETAGDIPLGRMVRPLEISATALFLASDQAASITGTSLVIDGGLIA